MIAGVIAVASMHMVDYVAFQGAMMSNADDVAALRDSLVQAETEEAKAELSAILTEYQNDPEVVEANNVKSFIGYIDYSARQGMEISSARHSGDSSMNIGYWGTYIYWSIEALIIASCAVTLPKSRAQIPFCDTCNAWKVERELGAIGAPAKDVSSVVSGGQIDALSRVVETGTAESAISVFECPCCGQSNDVVVQVSNVTYNDGSRVKAEFSRSVYPVDATKKLEEIFATDNSQPGLDDKLDPEIHADLLAAGRPS
jgi:hypothetical protein